MVNLHVQHVYIVFEDKRLGVIAGNPFGVHLRDRGLFEGDTRATLDDIRGKFSAKLFPIQQEKAVSLDEVISLWKHELFLINPADLVLVIEPFYVRSSLLRD